MGDIGENEIPGSGGNLNSVYDGWGRFDPLPGVDEGYQVGAFPAGPIGAAPETQQFRMTDSKAFNGLRGIAKTNFPFDPNPLQDHPNQAASSLSDNFQATGLAGTSSLLPGKYAYNEGKASMGRAILDEFEAGSSTFNSLPNAGGAYALDALDSMRGLRGGRFEDAAGSAAQDGINPRSIQEQFATAFATAGRDDLPVTPFHRTHPNFGNGHVEYGFNEPGTDAMSNDIIRAYAAVLPEGNLAGAKKDLMPVFSGISHEAVEVRPIMQSLGKNKNTLWLGGVVELPDELRVDPRQSLLATSNIPTGVEQTAGELASALDTLGFAGSTNKLASTSPYGRPLQATRTLAGTKPVVAPDFYADNDFASWEPLVFAGAGCMDAPVPGSQPFA